MLPLPDTIFKPTTYVASCNKAYEMNETTELPLAWDQYKIIQLHELPPRPKMFREN